jgi:hypothetical protein
MLYVVRCGTADGTHGAVHVVSDAPCVCYGRMHSVPRHAADGPLSASRCTLHRRRVALPQRIAVRCVAWCAARLRDSIGLRAGFAVTERRSVRCTRSQTGGGGVLSMVKGTALFDAVAISDTEAQQVRAGWGSDASCADGSWGGCRRFRQSGAAAAPVVAAAWCAWTMGPSRSRAARS